MDIDLLSKMVKELILDSDRVVLPGLGCFVAEIVPSTFSDKGYTINPPYRKLYFRSKPDQGDELVKFYAASNNVEMQMADRIITDFVAQLRNVLHTKKNVVFPGLGRLRATKENNVFFVADEDLDIYPDGFGLEPVSLKTNKETAEDVSAAVVGLKSLLKETTAEPVVPVVPVVPVEPVVAPVEESVAEPAEVSVAEPAEMHVEEISEDMGKETSQQKEQKRSAKARVAVVLLSVVIVMLVLLGVFFAVSRICPDWIDMILYSEEELQIINYQL